MNSLLKASSSTAAKNQTVLSDSASAIDIGSVLVREAGVPYLPKLGNVDPIAEWLSLMEVVQLLCPVWPVRDKPMIGKEWKL